MRAVDKRKSEFLAGRYLAKVTLQTLGESSYHVPIGLNREPIWPEGILGSISHSSNIAQCIIAYGQKYQFIGLDIEHWITQPVANNIANTIITDTSEYASFIPYLQLNEALTIIFSAKESLFKAIYKYVGEYFDFSAAQITSGSFADKKLTLTLIKDLSPTMQSGKEFQCTYIIKNDYVVTQIAE